MTKALIPMKPGGGYGFDEALLRGCCKECGKILGWWPGSTNNEYRTHCCGLYYTMSPETVHIEVEEE